MVTRDYPVEWYRIMYFENVYQHKQHTEKMKWGKIFKNVNEIYAFNLLNSSFVRQRYWSCCGKKGEKQVPISWFLFLFPPWDSTPNLTDQLLCSVTLVLQQKLWTFQVFFVEKKKKKDFLSWLTDLRALCIGGHIRISHFKKWKNLWYLTKTERQWLTCSAAWAQVNTTNLLCHHGQGTYALQTWEKTICLLLQAAVRIHILQNSDRALRRYENLS